MTKPTVRGNQEIKSNRMYRLEVKVVSPDGQELLNVIKVVFERNISAKRHNILDVNSVLGQLVEAAGEWPDQAQGDPGRLHTLPSRRTA